MDDLKKFNNLFKTYFSQYLNSPGYNPPVLDIMNDSGLTIIDDTDDAFELKAPAPSSVVIAQKRYRFCVWRLQIPKTWISNIVIGNTAPNFVAAVTDFIDQINATLEKKFNYVPDIHFGLPGMPGNDVLREIESSKDLVELRVCFYVKKDSIPKRRNVKIND